MTRYRIFGLRGRAAFGIACGLLVASAPPGWTAPSPRTAALVESFEVMCTRGDLNFAASDAKATAMQLEVRDNLDQARDANGYYAKSKSWLLPLESGAHEFVVAEGRGPKGAVKTCGIGEPAVAGDDMKAEILRTLKPGPPKKSMVSADGALRFTIWTYGEHDYQLMLTDASPKGQPGFYLTLMKGPAAK